MSVNNSLSPVVGQPLETLALKEWSAAVHALVSGRQSILLRKGGIHEKAFDTPARDGWFLLFPTVAHAHLERTKPEDRALIDAAGADVADDHVILRALVRIRDVVEVVRPGGLAELSDLHIWTDESIQQDRVDFRPTRALQILVVDTVVLSEPIRLARRESYRGCRSWIDVDAVIADPGEPVRTADDQDALLARVNSSVA